MAPLALRPYQEEGVRRLLEAPDRRQIFGWSVGAGKTLGAIACAQKLGAKRILVVASALARPVWRLEFLKWASGTYQPYTIRWGRNRKGLPKAEQLERTLAYGADVQIVSYALVKELANEESYDLMILDEVHALRNPLSKQSRIVKEFLRRRPSLPCLALTATPIPTEIVNVWNLVDTLRPSSLGAPSATGDVSWAFKKMYMESEVKHWPGGMATNYYGARVERLPHLKAQLAPLIHRVVEKDFAKYLPPIVASVLWVDDAKMTEAEIALEWLDEQIAEEATHVGLFAYTHELAEFLKAVVGKLFPVGSVFYLTGKDSPEARAKLLERARKKERAVIVATVGSVKESLSLSFIKRALVCEFRATPMQATQFLGRFARADSATQATTYVKYVAYPKDEERAATLSRRFDNIGHLFATDTKSDALRNIMSAPTLTDDKLASLEETMFASFNEAATADWGDSDDDSL